MISSSPEPEPTHRELASVRVSAQGLAEMDGPRRINFIPRSEVRGLELVHASAAERPAVTSLLGLALLLVALFPFAFLILIFVNGGFMDTSLFWFSGFGVPGGWLLWLAFKKRHVLLVRTSGGTRKLAFHSSASPEDIVRFITDAAPRFGYSVSVQGLFGQVPRG